MEGQQPSGEVSDAVLGLPSIPSDDRWLYELDWNVDLDVLMAEAGSWRKRYKSQLVYPKIYVKVFIHQLMIEHPRENCSTYYYFFLAFRKWFHAPMFITWRVSIHTPKTSRAMKTSLDV